MLKEHLYIGMSDKVWKKESFLKLDKTQQLLKKIMKKLELKLLKDKDKKKDDYFVRLFILIEIYIRLNFNNN